MSELLAIDLGNTRLKARCGFSRHACPTSDTASFERWLDGLLGARLVAWSCVAGPERDAWLERTCRARGLDVWREVRPDLARGGVRCEAAQPARVGSDRLWAASGAVRLAGRSCLVVQAGTCLVVDAVESGAGGAALLGGAIAPGLALLERALHVGTATLPLVDARSASRAPAITSAAEARRSEAMTGAPFRPGCPSMIAVWPSTVMCAPMRCISCTCIRRFSKMVSVMVDVPSATVFMAVNCACISVGKPG